MLEAQKLLHHKDVVHDSNVSLRDPAGSDIRSVVLLALLSMVVAYLHRDVVQ